jgi:hypothetical protein
MMLWLSTTVASNAVVIFFITIPLRESKKLPRAMQSTSVAAAYRHAIRAGLEPI